MVGAAEGTVVFFSKPLNPHQSEHCIFATRRLKAHGRDVLALDAAEAYAVSSGADKSVLVWNAFTGNIKVRIQMQQKKLVFVSSLRFLRKHNQYLLIVESNGFVHIASPITGEILLRRAVRVPEQALVDLD